MSHARARPVGLAALAVLVMLVGCTTVRITGTSRSSIEQRLVVRSLERAVGDLDTTPLDGRRVRVQLFALTSDEAFAREFVATRLAARGLRVVREGEPVDVVLKIFATALAVDTAETLVGVPAMQAPLLAIPVPEIALFKWERSRGHAETQVYTYDADGHLVGQGRRTFGQARYNRFTILIVISFSVSDLGEPGRADE